MSHCVGYANLFLISQTLLQHFLNIEYKTAIPHNLPISIDLEGIKTPERATPLPSNTFAGGFLFMNTPEILCNAVDEKSIRIILNCWGTFFFAPPVNAGSSIKLYAELKCPIESKYEDGKLSLYFQLGSASVEKITPEVLEGNSQEVKDIVYQTKFGDKVMASIQSILPYLPSLSFALPSLNDLVETSPSNITVSSLDGYLAIGVDVLYSAEESASGAFKTSGNMAILTAPKGGYAAVLCINDKLLQWKYSQLRDKIEKQLNDSDSSILKSAKVLPLNIVFSSGKVKISGTITTNAADVDFSFDLIPILSDWAVISVPAGRSVPDDPDSYNDDTGDSTYEYITVWDPSLKFQAVNIQVSIDVVWWAQALEIIFGVLSLGITQGLIDAAIAEVRGNAYSQVTGYNSGEYQREYTFNIPDTTEPDIRLRIETCDIFQDGIVLGLSVSVNYSEGAIYGQMSIPIDLVQSHMSFAVNLPYLVPKDDPQLKIRWELRHGVTGQILVLQDDANDTFKPSLFPSQVSPYPNTFLLTCRVYSIVGDTIMDYYNRNETIQIIDRLDRSKPYVRWQHSVHYDVYRKESDGSRTLIGTKREMRFSDIHKTRYPGRCHMVGQCPPDICKQAPRSDSGTSIEYLDTLPFSNTQLKENRGQLCDYCFFGGPDKTEPLPDD